MSLSEAKAVAEIGLIASERLAPVAAQAGKKLTEEALAEIFKKPVELSQALPRIREIVGGQSGGEVLEHLPQIIESVAGSKLANLKISRMLGSGAEELVLANDSRALKLSLNNLPRPVPHPHFDAPVLEHGKLEGGVRYYIQPAGQTMGVTDQHVRSVISKIRSSGFVEDDMWTFSGTRRDQVALFGSGQKPLLIDQGGALPAYGISFKNGEFVTHSTQQSNLAEIKDFLRERHIDLIKSSTRNPLNPLQMNERSLSTRIDDWQLTDKVKDYLKMTDAPPTMWSSWTDSEVVHALRSLALKAK